MATFIIGIFDDPQDALAALRALRQADFDPAHISLVTGQAQLAGLQAPGEALGLEAYSVPGAGSLLAAGPLAGGLAATGLSAALARAGAPQRPADLYTEGVQRGGTLVALTAPNEKTQSAVDLLNRFHPYDIERRSAHWSRPVQPLEAPGAPQPEMAQPTGSAPVVPGMAPAEGGLPAESLTGMHVTGASGQWREHIPEPSRLTQPGTPAAPDLPGQVQDQASAGEPSALPMHDPGLPGEERPQAGLPIEQHEPNFGRRVHDLDPLGLRDEPRGESVPADLLHRSQEASPPDPDRHDPGLGDEAMGELPSPDLLAHAGDPMPGLKPYPPEAPPEEVAPPPGFTIGTASRNLSGRGVEDFTAEQAAAGLPNADQEQAGEWDEFEPLWRNHFDTIYSGAPGDFDAYRPAYRHGFKLAGDARFRDQDWAAVETAARQGWEQDHPQQAWETFRDAVQAGWHSLTGR